MLDLYSKAVAFAANAHQGQIRKYTNLPYITHPLSVAGIVLDAEPCTPPYVFAAAVLHDVVEDTEVTILEIEKNFGCQVAELVEMLTDVSKLSDGNRKIRKHIDLLHTAQGSSFAHTIKLADLIDNAFSITKFDLSFAHVYMSEKESLLEVLKDGSQVLWDKATRFVLDFKLFNHI